MTAQPRLVVLSVQTSRAQAFMIEGKRVMSGIAKQAVSTGDNARRVTVAALGLEGDEQADPTVHGGLSKAVYAYPSEHYPFWRTVRAQAGVGAWDEDLAPGFMGENLTVRGLLETQAFIGDVLEFPHCTLALSESRQPCYKFQHVMGFNQAAKMMTQSGYCGFYLAVRVPGTLAAGDEARVVPGPRELSVSEMFKIKMRRRG